MNLDIDLTKLLLTATQKEIEGKISGPIPARVESFNAAEQTVDALPKIDCWVGDEIVTPKIQRDVPCLFLVAGSTKMTWRYESGDDVFLIPCDRDISSWIASSATTPKSKRRFSQADYVALPPIMRYGRLDASDFLSAGMRIQTNELQIDADAAITLNGSSTVKINSNEIISESNNIRIGSRSSSVPLAVSTPVEQNDNALASAIAGHTHDVYDTSVPPVKIGTAVASGSPPAMVSTAAAKVKTDWS